MKRMLIIYATFLCLPLWVFSQGTTCGTAIPLSLDGVLRNYSTSSSTGSNLVCGDAGDAPITWFSFTTNASAQCPILTITSPDSSRCEVGLVTGCGGNINNNLQVGSSICFEDGAGLWAPSETYVLTPNTVYYLRIKTDVGGTITIAGQHFTPGNDECTGALPVGIDQVDENNACHKPGPTVLPGQLCAHTLENTAFYQYYVASTGVSIINISSIKCDNGSFGNSTGFQIGFFTGSCGALVPLSCFSGAGDFVQATTPSLPAGTKVYVAIDGVSGSNCSYKINALNAYGVLGLTIKNFTLWQNGNANVLSWTLSGATVNMVDIERSADGIRFQHLSYYAIPNGDTSEREYRYADATPLQNSYYRLKVTGKDGLVKYSPVRSIYRNQISSLQVQLVNPVRFGITGIIRSEKAEMAKIKIVSSSGQLMQETKILLLEGDNNFQFPSTSLITGQYILVIETQDKLLTSPFIKM